MKSNPYKHLRKVYLLLAVISLSGGFVHCRSTEKEPRVSLSPYVNKETPNYYEERAKQYYDYKEYKKAIIEYEKLIEKFSPKKERYVKNLAWANYEIGFCYLVMKKYDLSKSFFEKVITSYDILPATTLAQQRLAEIEERRTRPRRHFFRRLLGGEQ